jgi:hypothetical protein
MCKHPLSLIPAFLWLLAGCATEDDRAAVGRAVVNTVGVTGALVVDGLVYENCDKTNSNTARDACLARNRELQASNKAALQDKPKPEFDDLESYKAKRDAELAKSE